MKNVCIVLVLISYILLSLISATGKNNWIHKPYIVRTRPLLRQIHETLPNQQLW